MALELQKEAVLYAMVEEGHHLEEVEACYNLLGDAGWLVELAEAEAVAKEGCL